MYDLIIRDATIVSSSGRVVADVAIQDGKIAYVGPRPPKRRTKDEVSAIGRFLIPGVIDTAVQFDPDGSPKEMWERETRAAVSGGVTSVVQLPGGSHPVVDGKTAQKRARRLRKKSWCNFGFWGSACLGEAGALRDGLDEGSLLGALAVLGTQATPGVCQASDLPGLMGTRGILGVQFRDIRDVTSQEANLLNALLAVVREHDHHVHLVHLSTSDELQILDPVRGDVPVTAGVTPHHLFLSGDNGDADKVHTNPPLRPEHDRRTLWTALKRGRLDCVASDHHPSTDPTKVGVPSSELLFSLMLSAVKYGRLSLELLVSLCSESPARVFGLDNKGKIDKGSDADLVLFAEGDVHRVESSSLLSSAPWSPYIGREAAPKPELVIVGGQVMARSGKIVGEKPLGTYLTRS